MTQLSLNNNTFKIEEKSYLFNAKVENVLKRLHWSLVNY